jgi:protein TonB
MKTTVKSLLFTISAMMILVGSLNAGSTCVKVTKSESPEYSEFAIAKGLQGTVIVEAVIDEHGHIIGADVIQSVHRNLDEAALAAVKEWTFDPATRDGKTIKQTVQIPLRFNLLEEQKKHLVNSDSMLASRG